MIFEALFTQPQRNKTKQNNATLDSSAGERIEAASYLKFSGVAMVVGKMLIQDFVRSNMAAILTAVPEQTVGVSGIISMLNLCDINEKFSKQ